MEHRMQILLRTMQPHIHSREEDRTRRREDKEGKSSSFGFGMPSMSFLEVLGRVDSEEELDD
jgi:hypothetical protein